MFLFMYLFYHNNYLVSIPCDAMLVFLAEISLFSVDNHKNTLFEIIFSFSPLKFYLFVPVVKIFHSFLVLLFPKCKKEAISDDRNYLLIFYLIFAENEYLGFILLIPSYHNILLILTFGFIRTRHFYHPQFHHRLYIVFNIISPVL